MPEGLELKTVRQNSFGLFDSQCCILLSCSSNANPLPELGLCVGVEPDTNGSQGMTYWLRTEAHHSPQKMTLFGRGQLYVSLPVICDLLRTAPV